MRHTLICTVGTSLKGNLTNAKDNPFEDLLSQKNIKAIALELSGIEPDHRLAGAEINSVTSIMKKHMIDRPENLYFLTSDTEDGDLVGQILQAYYERQGNPFCFEHIFRTPLEGLSGQSPQRFKTEGLRNLVKEISAIVRKHGAENILINATGGYKAQISFAGMIGQALGIPVCYQFEGFTEVIELPPQPISLDIGFWLENADLFFTLDQLTKLNELQHPSKTDERFSTLVEEIQDDGITYIGLSATGQLFHETFQHRFRQMKKNLLPPDSGTEQGKKPITFEDKNNNKHMGLQRYLENLCALPYVKRIYTHYYNPALPSQNAFKPSTKGGFSQIEGTYSDGKATTKFDIVTTAANVGQQNAVLVDLMDR